MGDNLENGLSKSMEKSLLSYYKQKVFSAAVILCHRGPFPGGGIYRAVCGTTDEKGTEQASYSTVFDLASLTKPLVTVLCILNLIEKKKISWESSLDSLIGQAVPDRLRRVDLNSLLNHSSGLAAHRDYWQDSRGIDSEEKCSWLLAELLREYPEYEKGREHLYSDLGYMLLGFVVEHQTGKKLDQFWYETIADPLDIRSELFFPFPPGDNDNRKFVNTGVCRWSGTELRGVVHDDNCRASGGVCGHAGLFGSAPAVMTLCQELLALYRGEANRLPLSAELFRYACRQAGASEWTAGFNLPSRSGSSSGHHFSPESIGHLGFTGTSFWIDVKKELIVVLLTNRVLMGDDQQGIKTLRPDLHNRVVEEVGKG